jgi:hypothetical protein
MSCPPITVLGTNSAYLSSIVNYLSLLGYASDTIVHLTDGEDPADTAWMHDFRRLVNTAKVTTHEVTSLLCLLSASITNRQPLPPYLKAPRPYGFARRLNELDSELLSLRHMAEPGFAAFAVLQISTRCIVGDMDRLLRYACNVPCYIQLDLLTVLFTIGSSKA